MNIMKNKIDFRKVLATWKAKSERNAKQLFSLGCKILHLVWDKKLENHTQRNDLAGSNFFSK